FFLHSLLKQEKVQCILAGNIIFMPVFFSNKGTAVQIAKKLSLLQQRGPPCKAISFKQLAVTKLANCQESLAKGVTSSKILAKMPAPIPAPQAPQKPQTPPGICAERCSTSCKTF